ncbi:DUF2306 domain-containing protein [Actinoallomurus acaciae]|uniref:DUF2306 domain-containing protein n=1 Tax=Actinoallomurus acaciae TaxID=502577 RepID=A0ABV5YHC1_9ACTN
MTTTVAPQAKAARGPERRRRGRPWALLVLGVVCAAALVYLLTAYIPPEMSRSRVPETGIFAYVLLVTHIFTASVALIAGPLQFWPWLRRHRKAHRWIGRAYLFVGVFPSAVISIPVSLQTSSFGVSSQLATGIFSIVWFGTGYAAYRAARRRRYADHRQWMIRNFALTFGKVTNTLLQVPVYLLVAAQDGSIGRGDDATLITHDIAGTTSWLAFVLNLLIVEWYIQRRYGSLRASRTVAPASRATATNEPGQATGVPLS